MSIAGGFLSDAATVRAETRQWRGETFLFEPRRAAKDVNEPDGPDPERQAAEIVAVFRSREADPFARNAYDPRADQRPGVTGRVDVVTFSAADAPAARRGDHLTRLSDGRKWRIERVLVTAARRADAVVNLIG